MRPHALVLIGMLSAPFLLGCSSDAGSEDFAERFVDACSTRSNIPQEVCACMAGLAAEEITGDAQTLLLAILEDDQEAAAELRGRIPVVDAMQAGMFMTEASRCAPPAN